ncbi:hypothetical protein [Bradyrhizobium prioriisuperbiae]|uniref:hypothetical protein n=1 Tax=Bradyrhizobium prioriisuperbiae TaxID=2854389 RepID=UPI0028E45D20|nr:hypothetical protein [Bradyrhizobium prioritasuperba]
MRSCPTFAAGIALLAQMAMAGLTAGTAMAGCREDHVAADQNLRKARAGIEKVAVQGTDAAKCASYRRYITALRGQREVMARCDTGPNQSRNVQTIDTEIASFAQRMRDLCKW